MGNQTFILGEEPETPVRMGTAQVYAAMREKFCAPEWAIFFEVANGTGSHGRNYADAIAMNLYPSRGLEVNGFEVKVSRSDWHRELKNPDKAERVFQYCDRWWLVVGDRGIVKDGELPINWGLLAPRGKSLAIIIQAPKLEPKPLDRVFFAALARRNAQASNEEIEAIVHKRVEEERERNKPHQARRLDQAYEDLRCLQQQVQVFEQESGIRLTSWNKDHAKKVGEAVKFLMSGGLKSIDDTLDIMQRHAEQMAKTIKAVRATPDITTQGGTP